MKRTEKLKSASNPLYFSNRKTKALEEALRVLLDAYEEYATQNSLTDEQASSAKQLIIDSYLERRAAYFVEHKLSSFDEYLDEAFRFALKKSFDSDDKENITRVFYYNNKHRLISNEQY